jgi:PKD repeat protein
MKRLIWTVVFLALCMSVYVAQTINEYTFSTTTDGTLQDMTGSSNFVGLTPGSYYDDNASAVTNIGFTFNFGLGAYTQFSVNSNGQMQLGATAISGSAASPAANTARIAPLNGDNAIRASGKAHYLVTGSAPNRRLVVEWLDLRVNYSSAVETGTYCRMQAWLYEGSNNIKFVYGTMWNMSTSAQSRGVYVSTSNTSGSIGMVYNITNTPTWANTGTSVTTTSFPASSAMVNLNSSADGSRRVFHINYPVYTSAPNPATLLSPSNGAYAMVGDVLSWQSGGGGPTGYDVYFGTFSPPPLVSNNQPGTSFTPTLVAGTTYYWKVVAFNQFGYADESSTFSFKVPTSTQLKESFEDPSFPPPGWANPGSWSRSTSYFKQGVASAYKYGSSSTQYILSTPKVTITPTSVFSLWTLCSTTTGTLQIVYSPDRTTWTQIGSNIAHAATYTWYNTNVDLSSLAGNNYYLGVRTGLASSSYYIDFCIGPEPTPEVPGTPVLSSPADMAIDVNEYTTYAWNAPTTGGVPAGYRIYCDTSNPPTTQIADVNTLTYTLTTPLSYQGTYYWTVEAYNAAGTGSQATVRSFTIRANPTITSFPWTVDFGSTGTTFPPINWTRWSGALANPSTLVSNTSLWMQDNWCNDTSVSPVNYSARMNIYGANRFGWIITPPIQIPGAGYQLEFDLALTDYSNSNPVSSDPNGTTGIDDKFIVLIGDGSSWTPANVVCQWDNAGSSDVYNDIPSTGTHVIIPLNAYIGTYQIAYYGESTFSNADNDLFIDNVWIQEIPVAPVFTYTPSNIDFGITFANLPTAYQNVIISNTGTGTIDLSTANFSLIGTDTAMFSYTTTYLPVSLATGQSVIIPVRYNPTALGNHSVTLRIAHNATNYDVALTGICTNALYESFESATFPPTGWTTQPTDWQSYTNFYHTGTKATKSGYTAGTWWLITPLLSIAPGSNTLSFWYRDYSESTSWDYTDEYTYVMVSTTGNGTADFTNTVWTGDYTTFTTTWQQATIDLSSYNGQNVFVAFKSVHTGGNYRIIDDVFGPDVFVPTRPLAAVNPTPSHQQTNVQLHPAFSWYPNPNSVYPAPTGYRFSLMDSGGYLVEDADIGNTTGYSYSEALNFDSQYSWKVVPYNTSGDAENCPTWTFTTRAAPTPLNLTGTIQSDHILLSWTAPQVRDGERKSGEFGSRVTDLRQTLSGYNIFRDNVQINSSLVTGTSYQDFSVVQLTSYEYYVVAVYQEGVSAPSNTISITFHTYPDIAITPTTINFGDVQIGSQAQRELLIENIGTLELQVSSISCPDPTISTSISTFSLQPAETRTIQLYYQPTMAGVMASSLTINSNAWTDHSEISVSLAGNCVTTGQVVIGNGTTNLHLPIYPYYGYTYTQSIYLQSEINIPEQRIDKLCYYWNGAGTANVSNEWSIYLGHTAKTVFDNTTDWIPTSNLQLSFTGIVNLPAVPGWIEIPLSTPFFYNNTDNLVVAVDENEPGYDSNTVFFFSTDTPSARSLRYYNDTINPNPAAPPTGILVNGYPNIQMFFSSTPSAPTLSCTPNLIDFGYTRVNYPTDWQAVTLTNNGLYPISFQSGNIVLTGSNYDQFLINVSTLPASMAPGQSAQVEVLYNPVSEGSHTAVLRITYSGSREVYDIVLEGEAINATSFFESFEDPNFPPLGWGNFSSFSRSTTTAFHQTASAMRTTSTTQSVLATPKLIITNNSTISYYARTTTANTYQRIQVVYSPDKSTWTPVGSLISLPSAGGWTQYSVDLSSLAGRSFYLGFRVYTTSTAGDIYIDNVFGPSLVPGISDPVMLYTPSVQQTMIYEYPTLSWSTPESDAIPSGYRVYCDTNSDPTTLVTTTTANSYTFSSPLSQSTQYFWKVIAFNSFGEATGNEIRSFTTRGPIVAYPYNVDFGSTGTLFPPGGWTKHSGIHANPTTLGTDGTGSWYQDDWQNFMTTPQNCSARINIWSTSNGWLISPPLQIPANNYELVFKLALTDYSNSNPISSDPNGSSGIDDVFAVMVGDGVTWTPANVVRQWDNAGSINVYNEIPSTGIWVNIPIGESGLKYIAFYGCSTISNADNDLFVDDICIKEITSNPYLSLSPSSLDFGVNYQFNDSGWQNITITNTGNGTLNLSPTSFSLQGESALLFETDTSGFPVSLAYGQSVSLPVRYNGSMLGKHNVVLRINDSRYRTDHDVPLSGRTITESTLYESFESTTFPPLGWANPGSFSRSTTSPYHLTACAYKYSSTSTYYILSTPKVQITDTSSLDFYARTTATNSAQRIQVIYSEDRQNWSNIGDIIALPPQSAWIPCSVDLGFHTGHAMYLGFKIPIVAATGSIYIDQVVGPEIIPEIPGAPVLETPINTAAAVNEYTIFTWSAPTLGIPDGYRLYCDTNNPPTTLMIDQAGTAFSPSSPFSSNTTYYWTVEAYTAAGTGPRAAVWSFTTGVNQPITIFPWSEDFGSTGSDFPPTNWTKLSGLYPTETPIPTTLGWAQDDFGNVTSVPPNFSGRLNIWSTTTKYWLVTPPITIPSSGYELRFDIALTTYSESLSPNPGAQNDDRFVVLISDNPLMRNASVLRQWDNTSSQYIYDNISNTGENHSINLNAFTGTRFIGFYGESMLAGGDNNVYIDNIQIYTPELMSAINPSPANLASSVSLHPHFSWEPNPNPLNPVPTGYRFSLWNAGGNLVENLDLGNVTYYDHPQALAFDTQHSWKVVPYTTVDAENCPTWTFTTTPALPPQNLIANATGDHVMLHWDAPSYRGQETESNSRSSQPTRQTLLGYNLFRDSVQLNTELIPDPSYYDFNVTHGITYTYYVEAVYEEGVSGHSNEVTLLFKCFPEIGVSAGEFIFGPLIVGQSETKTFTVTNTGAGVLEVSNIEMELTNFTISPTSFQLFMEESQEVQVTYYANEAVPTVGWPLTIHSNAWQDSLHVIMVSADAYNPANIVVSALEVNQTLVGDAPQTSSITIYNDGFTLMPLEYSFGAVPFWFSVNPSSGTIGEFIDHHDIVFTFYPALMNPGEYTYDLALDSNDPDTPSLTIHISATKQMQFYTTDDNENNAHTGIADNDMDVALDGSSPLLPVEFNILADAGPFYEAKLLILALGVDEASGFVHTVSFNGHSLGRLRGNATDWCSTVFAVDPAWIIPSANNLVQVYLDPDATSLTIDRGQMQINGQTRDAFIRTANVSQPLYPGATASVQLELDTSLSSQNVSIETSLYSPSGTLLARDSRNRTLSGQADDPFTVNLTIPASGYPGVYEVKVLVFSGTLGLLQDMELLPLQVNPYQSAIAYNPESLVFGQVLTNVTSSLPITIQNTGLAPLQVTQLTIDNPVFSVAESSLEIPAGGSYQLSVSYLPLSAGTHTGTLSLTCNDPINPYPQIALSGEGIPNIPYLNVSVSELGFGEVFTVVPQTLSFTVGNTGPAELFVWDITSSDPAFSAVPNYFSLTQNQSREVYITFSPSSAGAYNAQLTLSNNSANTPSYVLSVSGTGAIAPEITVSPLSITHEGFTGNVYNLPASISNNGGGNLNWQIVDHFGKALKTRGHTVAQADYAVIPNQTQNQLYGGNWTVSAWFKVESNLGYPGLGGKQYIVSKATETTNGFFGIYTIGVAAGSTGKSLAVQMRANSQNYVLLKENLLSLNTWYHVAVSYGSGNVSLFLNGSRLGSLPVPGYNGDPTAWALGKLSPTTSTAYRFCGTIDEFRVYSSALSDNEIKQTMFSRLSGSEPDLCGYWNLDSGSVNDLTAYADHGTLYGGATIIPSSVSDTPEWLGYSQTYGTTENGTPDQFNVVIDATAMNGGQYTATMQVHSNDPIQSIVQIPVSLNLTGYALISLSRENIDFGNVFVNETANQQLTIYNNGTDVLNVSLITSSNPAFSASQSSLQIAAGATAILNVSFNPTLANSYTGQLTLDTSVAGFETMVINLSGTGALHPQISLNPASFNSILDYGSEETQQLSISNLQGIPLEYQLSLQETGSRDLLNGDLDGFPANIRGMVFIGDLMYLVDYANARLLTYDPQTQTIIQQFPIHANPWGICYDGTNLWIGSQSGNFKEYNFAGELLRSFNYPLATNPSLAYNGSEFLIGKSFDLNPQIYRVSVQGVTLGTLSTTGLNGRLSQTTWVPWHQDGQLWAVDSQAKKIRQFSIQGSSLVQLQSINCNFQESASIAHNGRDIYVGENQAGHLYRVDDGITEFNWISVSPVAAEVASGQSDTVNLNFQARTRFAGNYTANLLVNSNDPLHPQITIPLTLGITGQPSLHLLTTIISHGHVFSSHSVTRELLIANLGSASLNVNLSLPAPYSVDINSFSLAPLSSRTVYVSFSPIAVGSYPASLTISSNDPVNPIATITLEGECVNPPIASASPLSISTSLSNTGQSELHTLTLSNTGGYALDYDVLLEELEPGLLPGSPLGTYQSFPDSTMGMVWVNSHLYAVNNAQAKLLEYNPITSQLVNSWGIHSRPCGITWDGSAFWIGDQSGYLYKYLPSDLLPVDSEPSASFKSPINGITSVCWTGTDFLMNNSWTESGNTTFYRVSVSGQTLATYSSNAGTYIAQTAWINQYQDSQFWAFQNVKEGDQFVSGKILKLSLSGVSVTKTLEQEFHDDLIGFSFTGDGKDLWYSDGNGPLYKLDDGRWLSASPVSGGVEQAANQNLDIAINPRLRNGGTYHANIKINTNDPVHPQLSIPVTLNLTGVPEISVEPSSLSFPDTFTGESSQLQLSISNHGSDILTISSITSNLGVYHISQQSLSIGIGATQNISISFSPLAVGAHDALLTILSNAGTHPSIQIPLSGTGMLRTAEIVLDANLVNFGNCIVGNNTQRDILIRNTGSGALNIRSFTFSSPVFSTLEQTLSIASGAEASLRMFFTPLLPIAYNGTLTISSNDPNQPEKIILLSGLGETGQSSIAIDPLFHSFGTVPVGSSRSFSFTVANQGNSELLITQISSDHPEFGLPSLPISVSPGATTGLEINFSPVSEQTINATLTLSSNDPLHPTTTLSLEGTGENVPILSCNPLSFDRYIVAETTDTQYLTLGNNGSAILSYSLSLSGNPVWLSLSQTAGNINPGTEIQIGLTINTTTVAAGTYQSAVLITSNDLNQPQKNIPVTLVHSDFNFTTLDNDNNLNENVPDGDLDVNINEYSAIQPVEFNIWTDQLNPSEAILRIRAYNISTNEVSELRINHHLVGTLRSSPSAWGISQFRVPASMLNFGNNVANHIRIDLDTTHQNPGSSRIDWGQLLFSTDGLFASIRYFYVDSSNHYPGSNLHCLLENDTQLYSQNLHSVVTLSNPNNEIVATNNLQSTISFGFDEPQGSLFTIPAAGQAGTWTLCLNLFDNDSSILQETRSITVEVGSYLPQLNLLSANVDFGTVFTGQSQARNLVVRNLGQGPLTVTGLQISEPAFSTTQNSFTLNYNQSQTVPLSFNPVASGTFTGILSITSNDAGSPTQVPLSGLAVNPPRIVLSEYSLTKQLYQTQTGTEQIYIYNQGESPLQVSMISRTYITGSGWLSISPSSASVQPGNDAVLNLNFNTGNLGTGIYDATLNLTSNDPENGYVVVPITLQVSNRPTANFTALPLSGQAPLTVQFTDTSTPLPGTTLSSWLWDFANNGVWTSTERNPQFTYSIPGTYSVKLTVTTNTGLSGSVTKTGYLNVLNNPPVLINPAQQLSINMLENTTNSSLNLNNVFSDPDGDPLSFSYQNVANVGLSISNGVVTITPAQYWSGLATLTFTARDNRNGQVSTTVQLTVNHINNPPQFDLPASFSFLKNTSYSLDFAPYVFDPDVEDSGLTLSVSGGSNINYIINGRMVTFTAIPNWTGTETLTLSLSDGIAEPTVASIDMNVLNSFNADFYADNLEPLAGVTVQFTDTTPGNPNYWAWEFNYVTRTINSYEQNPTYTYSFGGLKSVKLTVAYFDGNIYHGLSSVIKSDYINVRGTLTSGSVSGFWPLAGSPFVVSDNISIAGGASLEIQQDVSVIFLVDVPFQINGSMVANGVSFGTIDETAGRQTPVWKGLSFNPGSTGSNLQNINLNNAETPIYINGAQLSLAHVTIAKSDSLSLVNETGLKLENSSPNLNDIEITNYSKGISILNSNQTRTPITPSLTNVRIRNTSSSVRPDAIGIELTGFVEADLDHLDLQDFPIGVKYSGTGEIAGTNPSLTNVRIRNTNSSVRTAGTAIYIKDVPVFSLINNPSLPDSILGYDKGIVVETEVAASSNPTISNVRIRNTSSSVRTDDIAIEMIGKVSASLNNLDLTDYETGISASNTTQTYSTPSLTNVRIRNTNSSVRTESTAIVLAGKVSSSMNNITLDEYFNGISLIGDGTYLSGNTPTITNVRIRNTNSSVRLAGTAVSIKNLPYVSIINSPTAADSIYGYTRGIAIETTLGSTSNPTLSNVRIRNTSSSVRTDDTAIEMTGKIVPSFTNLDLDDYSNGIIHTGDGTFQAGQTPTLTNVRIRSTNSSVRSAITGLLIKDVPYYQVSGDSIVGYTTGISIVNELQNTVSPSITNVRIRNTNSSVRPDATGIAIAGKTAVNLSDLDIIDYALGVSLNGTGQESSTQNPSLTNVRIRNTSSAVRSGDKGIELLDLAYATLSSDTIEGYSYGVWITNTLPIVSAPTLEGCTIRYANSEVQPNATGIYSQGKVQGSIHDNLIEAYPLGTDLIGQNATSLTGNEFRNCNTGVRVDGATANPLLKGNLLHTNSTAVTALSAFAVLNANSPAIHNNTIYGYQSGLTALGGSCDFSQNIVWGSSALDNPINSVTANVDVSYNNIYDAAGVTPGTANLNIQPGFVNELTGDYHLSRYSPCIDAGNPTLPHDPDGSVADLGYQYYHHSISFTVDPAAGASIDEPVNFASSSVGHDPDTAIYQWSFGLSGQTDSYEANPIYSYTTAGTYDITLTMQTGYFSDTATLNGYVVLDTAALPVPQNVTAIAVLDRIELGWDSFRANSVGESCKMVRASALGFRIYRKSPGAGEFNLLAQLPLSQNSYSDLGLSTGTWEYYLVSYDATSESAASETADATVAYQLYPPRNLSAYHANGQTRLAWQAPLTNAKTMGFASRQEISRAITLQSYSLYRDGSLLVSLPADQTGYLDSAVQAGTTYSYFIVACYNYGDSSPSACIDFTPLANTSSDAMDYDPGNGNYTATLDPTGSGDPVQIEITFPAPLTDNITVVYSTNPDILSGLSNPDALGAYFAFESDSPDTFVGLVSFKLRMPYLTNDLWYRTGASWNLLNPDNWVLTSPPDPNYSYQISLDFSAKGRSGKVEIVSDKGGDSTLPIHLSAFTATLETGLAVSLSWTVESETDHLGYNLLRSETDQLEEAIKINPVLIDEGVNNGSAITYSYSDPEVEDNHIYYYWLESLTLSGVATLAGPVSVTLGDPGTPEIPVPGYSTHLMEAFPNPFNPNTNLRYAITEPGDVHISIYNLKGQLLRSYHNSYPEKGYYQVSWDGRDDHGNIMGSGVYLYKMQFGRYSATKKMILMK